MKFIKLNKIQLLLVFIMHYCLQINLSDSDNRTDTLVTFDFLSSVRCSLRGPVWIRRPLRQT